MMADTFRTRVTVSVRHLAVLYVQVGVLCSMEPVLCGYSS